MSEHAPMSDDAEEALANQWESMAAAQGLALPDFINEVLLQKLLRDAHVAAPVEAEFEEAPPAPEPRTEIAVRQRLDALERRLALAVTGLQATVTSLDGSMTSLAAHVEDHETQQDENARTIDAALDELRVAISALETDVDETQDAFRAEQESLREHFHEAQDSWRLEQNSLRQQLADEFAAAERQILEVEAVARAGDNSAARAHEDIAALRNDLTAGLHRTSTESEQLRAEFHATTESMLRQAEALSLEVRGEAEDAAARAISEMRALREELETRLDQSEDETEQRLEQIVARTGTLCEALAERIEEHSATTALALKRARAEALEAEASTKDALSALDEKFTNTDAALRGALARQAQAQDFALTQTSDTLRGEIADLRDRQLGNAARLGLLDAAMAKAAETLTSLTENLDARFAQASAEADVRLGAVAADAEQRLKAHTASTQDRMDTLALRLETVATETSRTREAVTAEFDAFERRANAEFDAREGRLAAELEDVSAQHKGALARIALLDEALQAQWEALRATDEKQTHAAEAANRTQLETAALISAAHGALARLAERVSELELQLGSKADSEALGEFDALAARLRVQETQAAETADRLGALARLIEKASVQTASYEAQAQDRLHKLEVALADLRLQSFSSPDVSVDLASLEAKLEALRDGLAHIAEVSNHRFQLLEERALDTDPERLRQNVEDRVLAMEQRCVRLLEQVSESVALLSRKFSGHAEAPPEESARSA